MNADTWSGEIGFYGHVYACGWCGARSIGGFPDCCQTMERWKLRVAASVGPLAPDEPDPDSHAALRWARVAQRISCKHLQAGDLDPALERPAAKPEHEKANED